MGLMDMVNIFKSPTYSFVGDFYIVTPENRYGWYYQGVLVEHLQEPVEVSTKCTTKGYPEGLLSAGGKWYRIISVVNNKGQTAYALKDEQGIHPIKRKEENV